jgi:hypothetical protein
MSNASTFGARGFGMVLYANAALQGAVCGMTMALRHDWRVELHRQSHDLARIGQAVLETDCELVVDYFGRLEAARCRCH